MRMIFFRIFIFLFILNVSSSVAENTTKVFNIHAWKTNHGIPVYFVMRKQIPMIDIAVVFDAGSARDGKRFGRASFTALLLEEGAIKMDAAAVARAFDSVGASFSASVDRDMAVISLRSLVEGKYFDPAFSTFNLVLSQPEFTEKSIERQRKQTLDGIRADQQSPSSMAAKKIFSILYGNQPYGHPVSGTLKTVGEFSRDEIVNFYKSFYVRQNAKIILVGDVSKGKALKLANQIDKGLSDGKKPKKLSLTVSKAKGEDVFVPMKVDQNAIFLGELGIARDNPHYLDLKVANFVLGGGGMISLLFDRIRNERGLAYSVYSQFIPLLLRGPFVLGLMTRKAKSDQAISVAKKTLSDYLRDGPTKQQLKEAKLNILGSFPLLIATNRAALLNTINIAFYHLPLDYLLKYPQKIKAVTVESAKQAFSKTINFNALNVVVAGKKDKDSEKK